MLPELRFSLTTGRLRTARGQAKTETGNLNFTVVQIGLNARFLHI